MAIRLVVLNHGQINADTTPNELLDRAAGQVWSLTVDTATAPQLQQQMAIRPLRMGAPLLMVIIINTDPPKCKRYCGTKEIAFQTNQGVLRAASRTGYLAKGN